MFKNIATLEIRKWLNITIIAKLRWYVIYWDIIAKITDEQKGHLLLFNKFRWSNWCNFGEFINNYIIFDNEFRNSICKNYFLGSSQSKFIFIESSDVKNSRLDQLIDRLVINGDQTVTDFSN